MKRSSKKGFTLAELLIVIAIIAVLVAIMIPVFSSQLDKARAAAELANVRAAYSELVADAMLGAGDTSLTDAKESVTINFSALKAAVQYNGTVITLSAEKPTTGGTTDAATMPENLSGADYYITVTYKDYFGSFKVDGDVTIAFNSGE